MTPRLAVVGPGRVGWALARAAAAAGYQITGVAGGSVDARARLAAAVGARPHADPAAADAELILLAIPDGALGELAETLRARSRAHLVHTAGALPAAALGVERAGSFHPLRSFAGEPRDVELSGCGVAIDADDEPLAEMLRRLAEHLGMLALAIPAAGRARYHAAAVLGGNASLALLDVARRQLDALGVPPQLGERALAALVASVADNVASIGIDRALSGPIRRGDAETVARHLAALQASDPEAAHLYRVLGRATLDVVGRLEDRPPHETLRHIEKLLREGDG